jgi:hypothetical protein
VLVAAVLAAAAIGVVVFADNAKTLEIKPSGQAIADQNHAEHDGLNRDSDQTIQEYLEADGNHNVSPIDIDKARAYMSSYGLPNSSLLFYGRANRRVSVRNTAPYT